MKKNYFFIFLFLLTQIVYAQPSTIIMSDDFSNPSNWIMTDLSNGGTQNWVIGTIGPIGPYSVPMGVIQSTTNANGFAILEKHLHKIDWKTISSQPYIFEYHYESMTKR